MTCSNDRKTNIRKTVIYILSMTLFLSLFVSGCGVTAANDGKIKVVATIFPEYDWVMNIIGDNPGNIEVDMLIDKGVDIHSYQPTAEDIASIATCDMFIYVGGESDVWVEDALSQVKNEDMIVINLLETLGSDAREEEFVEGMQEEDEEEEEEEEAYDEHVWLSLKNAVKFCEKIESSIVSLDKDNRDLYDENLEKYLDELKELDGEYEEDISLGSKDVLVFGDRFPFAYMTADYDLDYYAAFVGCSAETEASFDTIVFLADKVEQYDLGVVLCIETGDGKIAEAVINATDDKEGKVLTMNSMQMCTMEDYKDGKTYLSIMKDNLEVLREALK